MTHKYDLESLIETFKEHTHQVTDYEKERCKREACVYIENFSISKALQVICEEIQEIKRVEQLKNTENYHD